MKILLRIRKTSVFVSLLLVGASSLAKAPLDDVDVAHKLLTAKQALEQLKEQSAELKARIEKIEGEGYWQTANELLVMQNEQIQMLGSRFTRASEVSGALGNTESFGDHRTHSYQQVERGLGLDLATMTIVFIAALGGLLARYIQLYSSEVMRQARDRRLLDFDEVANEPVEDWQIPVLHDIVDDGAVIAADSDKGKHKKTQVSNKVVPPQIIVERSNLSRLPYTVTRRIRHYETKLRQKKDREVESYMEAELRSVDDVLNDAMSLGQYSSSHAQRIVSV